MSSRCATATELLLVSTPIGNLGDLSPRAIEALAAAALICCEDTRRTGRLLQAAGVTGKRLAVCNEHTERRCIDEVLEVLGEGGSVALVTDAGTPGISDPGEILVGAVLDAGHEVSTVPGPAAFVAALVSSGLPTTRFVFEGFLPRSGVARRDRLAEIAAESRTVVLYEAPHRVVRTIRDLTEVCGPDRPVAVARELTKLYETVVRGTLGRIDLGTPRGEYVIVLGGVPAVDVEVDDDDIAAAVDSELSGGASTRDAAARAASTLGVPRRRAYDIAVRRPAAR
jgi:16S rRNA (cytidine1402-2'-O)-methyltransferase